MMNEEAIMRVTDFLNLIGFIDNEDEKAYYMVLSLAERMAMYEWWWGLTYEEDKKYGLLDVLRHSENGTHLTLSDKKDFELVMKAWKEKE